jgi:hypothetical protein
MKLIHKYPLFGITLSFLFFCGCFQQTPSKKTQMVKPDSIPQSSGTGSSSVFNAITYYRDNRLPMALNEINAVLASQPSNWDSVFWKGMIFLKSSQEKDAFAAFSSIPEGEREMLMESCTELQQLKKDENLSALALQAAKSYFKDCLEEWDSGDEQSSSSTSGFSKARIIELGKLYEDDVLGIEDPQLRAKKETEFLKKNSLTKDQIDEISGEYLNYLAEDQ